VGKPGRATQEKKRRERKKQEKRQEKLERRDIRKSEKKDRLPGEEEEDPDIAGIVPGPQPVRDDY